MPYTVLCKNQMLNAIGVTHVSLHTAYPGEAGANEIVGGSFARKAISFAAASNGSRDSSTQPIMDVPPNTTFAFWSGWNAAEGGDQLLFGAIGGTRKFYSVDPANNAILSPGHGFEGGERVVWLGSAPTGLSVGQIYYVVNATPNQFSVATSLGGQAVGITGVSASGILTGVQPQTSGPAGGQYTLDDADLYL